MDHIYVLDYYLTFVNDVLDLLDVVCSSELDGSIVIMADNWNEASRGIISVHVSMKYLFSADFF